MTLLFFKKLALLGEASHGTSEYYTWRADISKHLIQTMGFKFIAVEADGPSACAINRYVKNLPGAAETAEKAMEAFVQQVIILTFSFAGKKVTHFRPEFICKSSLAARNSIVRGYPY